MARRTTVKVKCEVILLRIRENEWSNAAFSRKAGKYDSWFSEVTKGRNLPSPEEAARMCAILQVEPEEILTEPSDIELVRSLIEQERSAEKKLPAQGGEPDKDELISMVERVTNEATLRAVLNAVNKKFQELG